MEPQQMEPQKMFVKSLASNCEIEERCCKELCTTVFEAIAKSLGYSAGVQFVMQLPYEFQAGLLNSYDGPDHSVTAQSIVHDAADILRVPPEGARHFLKEVWQLLVRFTDQNQLRRTTEQLPPDVLELFVLPESPVRHDFEQWIHG